MNVVLINVCVFGVLYLCWRCDIASVITEKPEWIIWLIWAIVRSTRTKWLKNVWKMSFFVRVVTHYGSNESNDSLSDMLCRVNISQPF